MLLSTLLCRRIGRVKVTVQKVVPPLSPDAKGIRLDVKVEETLGGKEEEEAAVRVYDIEPHLRRKESLARRNRFYQAMTDSSHLKRGERDYGNLPDLYVLTILDKDPFGYNQMVYSIRNRCEEVKEL